MCNVRLADLIEGSNTLLAELTNRLDEAATDMCIQISMEENKGMKVIYLFV